MRVDHAARRCAWCELWNASLGGEAMNAIRDRALAFLRSEEGPTATEYGVLIAVICVAVIGALSAFGSHMNNLYVAIDQTVPNVAGS